MDPIKVKTCGIIVGADKKIEYLLPYFYLNLRLNTSLPIVFFDFGMTVMGKSFCEKRGQVIPIEESLWSSEEVSAKNTIKTMWFKKPLACKKAPFDLNLWLDLDCKIVGPFDDIFSKIDKEHWLALRMEGKITLGWLKMMEEHPHYLLYNSGVMLFEKDSPFIDLWIDGCHKFSKKYNGDQDILGLILMDHPKKVGILDKIYNFITHHDEFSDKKKVKIFHHVAYLKADLLNEYIFLEKMASLKDFSPILSTKGIIVGLNAKIEYLLPFFYLNLRLNCSLPIVFFDFGMSAIGRSFCEKRGQVIEIEDSLFNNPDDPYQPHVRNEWFKKPLACSLAPFDINLWIDLDCLVRGPIDEILSIPSHKWLRISPEYTIDFSCHDLSFHDLTIFNSGVFAFRKDSPLIDIWIKGIKNFDLSQLVGDQDILSFELYGHFDKIQSLDPKFNALVSWKKNPYKHLAPLDSPIKFLDPKLTLEECSIIHFYGSSKSLLLTRYQALEAMANSFKKENEYV